MLLIHTAGTRETKTMCLTGEQPYSRRYICSYFHTWKHSDFLSAQYVYPVTVLTVTLEYKIKT